MNLIAPGTLYGDRVNELDFRIAKVLRFGRTRTQCRVRHLQRPELEPGADLQPGVQHGDHAVAGPTAVLQSRFVKISAQIDF